MGERRVKIEISEVTAMHYLGWKPRKEKETSQEAETRRERRAAAQREVEVAMRNGLSRA